MYFGSAFSGTRVFVAEGALSVGTGDAGSPVTVDVVDEVLAVGGVVGGWVLIVLGIVVASTCARVCVMSGIDCEWARVVARLLAFSAIGASTNTREVDAVVVSTCVAVVVGCSVGRDCSAVVSGGVISGWVLVENTAWVATAPSGDQARVTAIVGREEVCRWVVSGMATRCDSTCGTLAVITQPP